MQELEFAELDENGRLVVVAEDGTRYAVPVDDRLRVALRPRRVPAEADGSASAAATPREVQAMIRAGQSAEDVASATGWDLARVRRFEGPVLAEREHVVGLARAAHVRAQGRTDGSHTLERRVRERLQSRGVPPADTRWDAARTGSQGPWTVVVSFIAGGRERLAAWHYEVQDRSIEALDDEARWLSEDEQALPGGLAGHPLLGTSHAEDETADLMAAMRERRQARGRRGRRQETGRSEERGRTAPGIDNEPLPLEDLPYDPETMGDPPAAHPRGSAPEAPAPVRPEQDVHAAESSDHAVSESGAESPTAAGAPASAEGGAATSSEGRSAPAAGGSSRAKRERRRLRIPKLPPVLGDPEQDEESDEAAEIAYARTHDPQEVSFDEFFGTDEDEGLVPHGEELDDALLSGDGEPLEEAAGPGAGVEDLQGAEGLEDAGDEPGVDAALLGEDELLVGDEMLEEDEPGDEDAVDAVVDVGQDEPVPDDEQIAGVKEAVLPDAETADEPRAPGATGTAGSREPLGDDGGQADPAPAGRRKGRPSVPSWDDIMFGGGDRRRG